MGDDDDDDDAGGWAGCRPEQRPLSLSLFGNDITSLTFPYAS